MGELEDNLEALFLLEILVDNVQFEKPTTEEDLKETCVGFQFLKYPPLIICEEDFVYMGDDEFEKQNVQFKSGKSLLFALPSLQENDPNLGSIHVWVTRRIARTDKTKVMGSTDINLSGSFENLLQASAKQNVVSPLSKYIRDSFQFKNEGNVAGTLTAFLRVSCFGKLIVTQFEVKGKEKFTFKGLDNEKDGGGADTITAADRAQIQGQAGLPPSQDNGGMQGMHPYGPGMFPGGPGIFPGGQGMFPGGPGMFPGGPGMFQGGPGMSPGGFGSFPGGSPSMYPGSQGLFMGTDVTGQSVWNGLGVLPGACPGPKPWLHGKRGVLPCGEPKCPTGACVHFPCSHAEMCTCSSNQMGGFPCSPMGGFPGMYSGPRARLVDACPTDRNTQVIEEEIILETKPNKETTPTQDSKIVQPKAKGKGKKDKGKK